MTPKKPPPDEGLTDWFNGVMAEANDAMAGRPYDPVVLQPARAKTQNDPISARQAAKVFQAVNDGAPMLGSGAPTSWSPPTIGKINPLTGRVRAPRPGSDTFKEAVVMTPESASVAIIESIKREKPEDQRRAASLWLTKLTRDIAGFVKALDEDPE